MLTETITWVPVGERLPDADLTVHVAIVGGSEPVWLGYFDGDHWYGVDGFPIEVSHWADMPHGPQHIPACYGGVIFQGPLHIGGVAS